MTRIDEVKVVGIDPSVTATGVAVFHRGQYECSVVGREGVTKLDSRARLRALEVLLTDVVGLAGPDSPADLVVIEEPFGTVTRGGGAGLVPERGWLFYELVQHFYGRALIVHNAKVKKYLTGKGNANKGAMTDAMARRAPMWVTRGNDNMVDAAALAMIGLHLVGNPIIEVPASHLAALKYLRVPFAVVPAQNLAPTIAATNLANFPHVEGEGFFDDHSEHY